MSEVKRYAPDMNGEMEEHEEGEWVKHEDCAALVRDRDTLAVQVGELRGCLERFLISCNFEG